MERWINTPCDLRIKGGLRVSLRDGLAAYQLVGEVKAHQGDDG